MDINIIKMVVAQLDIKIIENISTESIKIYGNKYEKSYKTRT